MRFSAKIKVRGDPNLVERMRKVLVPDFKQALEAEKLMKNQEEAVWEIEISEEKVSRLRALTNSILRAVSLFLEVEGIFESSET